MRDGETHFLPGSVLSLLPFPPRGAIRQITFYGRPYATPRWDIMRSAGFLPEALQGKMYEEKWPSFLYSLSYPYTLSLSLCPSSRCAKICHSTRVTGRNLTFLWASEEFYDSSRPNRAGFVFPSVLPLMSLEEFRI